MKNILRDSFFFLNRKKIIPVFILVVFAGLVNAQVTIPTNFFGQNYWLGYHTTLLNDAAIVWPKIAASGTKIIRYGGSSANVTSPPPSAQAYKDVYDDIYNRGYTPIIQISFDGVIANLNSQVVTAVAVVTALKSPGRQLYFSIGNEPKIDYNYDLTINTERDKVVTYVKTFANRIKEVDETAIIIAPDIESFSHDINSDEYKAYKYLFENGRLESNIDGISPYTNSNTLAIGKKFVDIVSYHMYPGSTLDCGTTGTAANRTEIISYADKLKLRIAALKALTGNGTRKIAITEFNTTDCDPFVSTYDANTYDSRGFIAGQFIANLMLTGVSTGDMAFMNMWSMKEGSPDRGFLSGTAPIERSSYWHFQMVAQNFKGTYLPNSYTTPYYNSSLYKAFAYKNTAANELGVLIMNQNQDNSNKSFKIYFQGGTPSGYEMLFSIDGSGTAISDYHCTITKETTMLLVFDITTGALKKRQTYSLQDALRTSDTGTMTTISSNVNPTLYYDSYTNPTYPHSDIKIGTDPSTTITAGVDKTFKATNSIQLNGPFLSNGKTISLSIDQACP